MEAIIYSRSKKGVGCPYCANRLVSNENNLSINFPEIAKEWHPNKNENLSPRDVLSGSDKRVWWLCHKDPTHEWETKVYNRTVDGRSNCPICCFTHTNLEKFVEDKLSIYRCNTGVLFNSTIKYRPDFQLSKDLYLNVDGLYWHSECQKVVNYHFKMREDYEAEGKRILQFYEDEIYHKWNIVESIINNSLGKTSTKISARKCRIEKVSQLDSNQFLLGNHLMGSINGISSYGLYYNDELISMISIKRLDPSIEISRFCTRINTNIRGGFSRLLKHVIKLYHPNQVVSFCDLRYATGRSYVMSGFQRVGVTQGWNWTDFKNRYNRLYCRATIDITEKEHAQQLRLIKIYDAGQAKYILEL